MSRFSFQFSKREVKSFTEEEKHQVLISECLLAAKASRTAVSVAKIVVHCFPHAFVCPPVDAALGAKDGAWLGLPVGMDVDVSLVGANVGARLGFPNGMDVGFFLVGAEVGARLGLPEGIDVNFFLVGANVGARLGFPAVTAVGFLEGPFGWVGVLVGLIVIVSVDCFKARSSSVDERALQTAVMMASDGKMWKVIMTKMAFSQMT